MQRVEKARQKKKKKDRAKGMQKSDARKKQHAELEAKMSRTI